MRHALWTRVTAKSAGVSEIWFPEIWFLVSRVYDRERVSNVGILYIRCMRRVT